MSKLGAHPLGTRRLGESADTSTGDDPTGPLSGEWTLDGITIPEPVMWSRSPQTLSISTKVYADSSFRSTLAPIADVAGKVQTIVTADGGYTTYDNSTTGTSVTLDPPAGFKPHLVSDTFYLNGYDESPADDGSIRYNIRMDFKRDSLRDPEDPADVLEQTAAADEFEFTFEHGTIAVPASRVQDASEPGLTMSLAVTVRPPQGEVILETLGTVSAAVERDVPGGDNYFEDTTAANRNTVSITSPSGTYVSSGDYIVVGWSLAPDFGRRWNLSIELA